MKSQLKWISTGALALLMVTGVVLAHCQIPCGIYGDDTRFTLMREHVTTIEKSMSEITRLGKQDSVNHNQVARWVLNKETHSDELAGIVTSYFMAQRVKPLSGGSAAEQAAYVEQITLLHRVLVTSMKAKQQTDVDVCAELNTLIDRFETSYGGK